MVIKPLVAALQQPHRIVIIYAFSLSYSGGTCERRAILGAEKLTIVTGRFRRGVIELAFSGNLNLDDQREDDVVVVPDTVGTNPGASKGRSSMRYRVVNLGNKQLGFDDLFTSTSPCKTLFPTAPSPDDPSAAGQNTPFETVSRKKLSVLRSESSSSTVASDPVASDLTRKSLIADGEESAPSACASVPVKVKQTGAKVPRAYVNCANG